MIVRTPTGYFDVPVRPVVVTVTRSPELSVNLGGNPCHGHVIVVVRVFFNVLGTSVTVAGRLFI